MGSYRSNFATIRAGSNERIAFTLYANNAILDLSPYDVAELRLKRISDDHVVVFRTDDTSPILSFALNKTIGEIYLDPSSITFQNDDGLWAGYINLYDSLLNCYSFEEDEEFGIKVRNTFTTTSTSTSTSTSTTTTP